MVALHDRDLSVAHLYADWRKIPGSTDRRVHAAKEYDCAGHGASLLVNVRAIRILGGAELEPLAVGTRHTVEAPWRIRNRAGPRHDAGNPPGRRGIECRTGRGSRR